jgi:hypothetical protein
MSKKRSKKKPRRPNNKRGNTQPSNDSINWDLEDILKNEGKDVSLPVIKERDGTDIITGIDLARPYATQQYPDSPGYFLVGTWNWIDTQTVEWKIIDDSIARWNFHKWPTWGKLSPSPNNLDSQYDDYTWDFDKKKWLWRSNSSSDAFSILDMTHLDYITDFNRDDRPYSLRAFTTSTADYISTQSTRDMKMLLIDDSYGSRWYFLDANGSVVAKFAGAHDHEAEKPDMAQHPDYKFIPNLRPFPLSRWSDKWGVTSEEAVAANIAYNNRDLNAISKYYDASWNPIHLSGDPMSWNF